MPPSSFLNPEITAQVLRTTPTVHNSRESYPALKITLAPKRTPPVLLIILDALMYSGYSLADFMHFTYNGPGWGQFRKLTYRTSEK